MIFTGGDDRGDMGAGGIQPRIAQDRRPEEIHHRDGLICKDGCDPVQIQFIGHGEAGEGEAQRHRSERGNESATMVHSRRVLEMSVAV